MNTATTPYDTPQTRGYFSKVVDSVKNITQSTPQNWRARQLAEHKSRVDKQAESLTQVLEDALLQAEQLPIALVPAVTDPDYGLAVKYERGEGPHRREVFHIYFDLTGAQMDNEQRLFFPNLRHVQLLRNGDKRARAHSDIISAPASLYPDREGYILLPEHSERLESAIRSYKASEEDTPDLSLEAWAGATAFNLLNRR